MPSSQQACSHKAHTMCLPMLSAFRLSGGWGGGVSKRGISNISEQKFQWSTPNCRWPLPFCLLWPHPLQTFQLQNSVIQWPAPHLFVSFCFCFVSLFLARWHRLAVLPPQPLRCCDYRCVPPHLPLLLCWFRESNSDHPVWQPAASSVEPLPWSFFSFKRSVFISHHLNDLEHLTLMATVCI